MKTSSDAPKFFAWEVRTFDHFRIPQECWLKLNETEKRGLAYLSKARGEYRCDHKYLCMIKNRLYLSDGKLSIPHLPPSKNGFAPDDDEIMVNHIVRFALTPEKPAYPTFCKITDEEAEEVYLAEKKTRDKLFKLIAKKATHF